jgi:hypothetical protein
MPSAFNGSEVPNELKVFPNPVQDNLNLQLGTFEPGDYYVIFNSSGEKLISDKIMNIQSRIDFASYPAGLYLLAVNSKNRIRYEKIIKR